MHGPAPEYEIGPFAPGQAPFRVKGGAYRGHMDYVNEFVPGGMKATLDALVSEEQRDFWDRPFLAASFYDVYPLIVMGHVCARIVGKTYHDFLRVRARYQAEKDIGGVYKYLLKVASIETVALKVPLLVAQYFDHGPTTVRQMDATTVEMIRTGLPPTIATWFSAIGSAYIVTAMELNGAKNPFCKVYPYRATGEMHGVEVGSIRFELSWSS